VAEKLRRSSATADKPWMAFVGQLRHLRRENARINRVIEEEFEQVEPEEWS
jgi:hypothetical protein